MATADMPPYASERRNPSGKISSPANAMTSNVAENATVRPEVATVARTASAVLRPAASSSRNRPTVNRP